MEEIIQQKRWLRGLYSCVQTHGVTVLLHCRPDSCVSVRCTIDKPVLTAVLPSKETQAPTKGDPSHATDVCPSTDLRPASSAGSQPGRSHFVSIDVRNAA